MSRLANAVSIRRLAARVAVLVAAAGLSACGSMGSAQLRSPDGQLAPCSAKRCVSSRATDSEYFIEPLRYPGTRAAAHAALLRILATMPGASVETQTEDYVHATFTTRLMRYVDDLELEFPDGERVVHVRSSSRLGYYDFDANRERVETLRARFDALKP